MSTDNLDLDGLAAEARAAAGRPDGQGTMSLRPQEVLALIDRIKELEAERENLIYSRDIQAAVLRAERARADRAEARLTRVTDEVNGYLDSLDDHIAQDDFGNALAAIRAVAADEQEAGREPT